MATDFNASQWAGINTRQPEKRDFNADFAEAAVTQEGFNRGLSPNKAVMGGMRSRQAAMDPMYELKRSQAMLGIATAAQQFQEGILSSQIKRQQIDDEAADTLALSGLSKLKTWEEKSQALMDIVPKSARGIQQASQMRLQLSQLRQMDWTSRAMLKIADKNPALAFRLGKMDPDSQEYVDAIQEAGSTTLRAGSIEVDQNYLNRVRQSGDLNAIAEVERAYNSKYPSLDERQAINVATLNAREKSDLRRTWEKAAAVLDAEVAELEQGTSATSKKYAAGARARAQSFRDRIAELGNEGAAPASTTNAPSSMNFIFKDGQLVPAR